MRPVHTFSIVARDSVTGDIGVAVQSHWFSVGSLVTWAEAGVGAVATQSFVDPSYGPLGLDLMRAGKTARQALEVATRGGAEVLGRADLGSLEAGKCADLCAIKLDKLEYAGGLHDPVSAVVFCAPVKVDYTLVHGRVIVKDGELLTMDVYKLVEQHNQASRRLVDGTN